MPDLRRINQLSLLATASVSLYLDDPTDFEAKMLEKARQVGGKVAWGLKTAVQLSKIVRGRSEAAGWTEFGEGRFDEVLKSPKARFLAKVASKRKIRQFEIRIEKSQPLSDHPQKIDKASVIFYHTNSLPYTQSGYTLRTQNILSKLAESSLKVIPVTRLGYPIVIGKRACSKVSTVGSVQYEHVLPAFFPMTVVGRHRKMVDELVAIAQRESVTLLHTTTDFRNAQVVSHAAKKLGIPWTYEVRGEPENTWLTKFPKDRQEVVTNSTFYIASRKRETDAVAKSGRAVVLSNVSRNRFLERGVGDQEFVVVPNGIAPEIFNELPPKNELRKILKLPNSTLVGTVTSVVNYEGLEYLIRALLHLPSGVNAIIVGDGAGIPELRDLTNELSLDHRVCFVGRQPAERIAEWYKVLDVFVVPRLAYEVCKNVTPLKAITAQALGVPVVASELPALREVTGDRAIYVRPESAIELADGIAKALNQTIAVAEIQEWAKTRDWKFSAIKFLEALNIENC